jgi:hypothetical protein
MSMLPPLPAPDATEVVAEPPEAIPAPPRPVNLTSGWRVVLAGGWLIIMVCLGLVANQAWLLGSPPFWLDSLVLPYILPLGTCIAALVDWRHTLLLSWLAAIVLAAVGLADVILGQPVVALFEGALALSGLLLTGAVAMARR